MKLNKIILVSMILLIIISLSAVNAQDNSTSSIDDGENFEVSEDMQTNSEDKLSAFSEDFAGNMTSDDVTVNVSNVFKGCETTISVIAPEAIGKVNITVNENIYAPEFIDGVATQSISNYSVGLNNVSVNYKGIVKETSFKVLDGVITNETFDDYFELVGRYYYLRSFIPEDATLDFRGHISYMNYREYGVLGTYITKPHNITSTTCDADLDVNNFIIQRDAFNSNVSNIKMSRLSIYASNCNIINSTIVHYIWNAAIILYLAIYLY